MSKHYITLAILTATLTGGVAWGQTAAPRTAAARPATGSPGTVIAVIDTLFVMKKHAKMVAFYENLNKKIKANQADAQNFAKDMQKEREKLRDLKVGSDEYRNLMQTLIQRDADYAASAKVRDAQLSEEKAKMELETYLEVQDIIRNFATRKGIDLVLSYDSEKPSIENPQSLQRAVLSTVQYQSDLDITQDILNIVNASQTARGGAAPPATTRPTTRK